jgi:N-acetylmuramoyl-L-alanine amidase
MRLKNRINKSLLNFLLLVFLIVGLLTGTAILFHNSITTPMVAVSNPTPTPTEFASPASEFQYMLATQVNNTETRGKYRPRYEVAIVDPSNYGERYTKDANGVPVHNRSIIVLHETSFSAASAINTFQTPHTDEKLQVSYHSMIKLDGTIVYLVPPEKRAFGAGNSVFQTTQGIETVKTNQHLPPSVNNFAYHVSLETPPQAEESRTTHEGYTEAQYNSLAWLISQSTVPDDRITTHRAVDRSGLRIDPRSFDFQRFFNLLHTYRQRI